MDKKIGFIALLLFVIYAAVFFVFPRTLSILELEIFDRLSSLDQKYNLSQPRKDTPDFLKNTVIIAIDEATLEKLHKRWPLPRTLYAQLVSKLSSVSPRFVVFDVIFSGASTNPQDDLVLKQSLQGKRYFLFPYTESMTGDVLSSDFANETGIPLSGYVNRPSDEDSSVRRVRPFTVTLNNKIIEYAVELYACSQYLDYNLKSITIDQDRKVFLGEEWKKKAPYFRRLNFRLNKDTTLWMRFRAGDRDFYTIPLWKVLDDNFDASVFTNKIVFVGATARILHDTYHTPLGLMPGVKVVANSMLMFLNGDLLEEVPQWFHWCIIFIFCFLITAVSYRSSIIKGFLFMIAMSTLISFVSLFLFFNGFYLNPLKLILVCVIGYTAINFYKYTMTLLENIRLMRMSTIDELTGLYMFRYYKIVFEHEFQKYLRYKIPLSLLMLDIDNFKKINDTYGHPKGNVVLNKIGSIVQNNVRKADFPARYGGEEIAVLLPNSNVNGARICAEHLRELIAGAEYFMTKEGPLKVTVSIGVASTDMEGVNSSEDLLKFADTALYTAKKTGKNKVVVYDKNSMVEAIKQ